MMLGALNTSVEMYLASGNPTTRTTPTRKTRQIATIPMATKPGLTPKPVTNSFTLMADHEIDGLIERYRESEDPRDHAIVAQVDPEIHDHGAYVPGWVRPWYRVGQWRWVKYPKITTCARVGPFEFHIHWIDSDEKARTLKAMEDDKASGLRRFVFDK